MALTLPTFTITEQAKIDRLLAAFTDAAGYKEWLKQAIITEVRDREARKMMEQNAQQIQANNQSLQGFMDSAT